MKLQQATRCAILATLHVASRPDQQFTASELAEVYGMSQHHLAKVLKTLSRANIVVSTRGAGGGCSFAGDQRKISLFDIINLFEPDLHAPDTAPDEKHASDVSAELARVLTEIDRLSAATLQSVTLQTIINNTARHAGRLSDQIKHL